MAQAWGISLTKDGKIRFWIILTLQTKLLGKVSFFKWDFQRLTLSMTKQGMDRHICISCPGEMAVRIPYSYSNMTFILFLNTLKGQTTAGDPSTFTELQYNHLYPGVELSWNAEVSKTYQFSNLKLFVIWDDVLPGDFTKYLSLPWQSDFYVCHCTYQ